MQDVVEQRWLIRLSLPYAAVLGAHARSGGCAGGGDEPNVVISQVYGGGGNAGAPFTNDFIELFNRGTTRRRPGTAGPCSTRARPAPGTSGRRRSRLSGRDRRRAATTSSRRRGGAAARRCRRPTSTGPINMSGTAGKVALVTTRRRWAATAPRRHARRRAAQIIDLVGYGSANFFEGTAPRRAHEHDRRAARTAAAAPTPTTTAPTSPPARPRRATARRRTPCGGDDAPASPPRLTGKRRDQRRRRREHLDHLQRAGERAAARGTRSPARRSGAHTAAV